MSTLIHTFASLPESLRGLAIELALIRARQDQYGNLRNIVEEAVVAAAAAAELEVSIEPHAPRTAVDPAKPGSEETVTQQVTAGGPNPDYVDPEIFDPKENNDALDALGFFLETLLGAVKPEQHCGRPDCVACNTMFGEVPDEGKANKLRFQQIDHKEGIFGPVDVYRSSVNPAVYAVMNRGKTALIQSPNIDLLSYQAAVEIVRVHGKEDRSIVG